MSRPRIALTVSAVRTPANLAARQRYIDALRDAGTDDMLVNSRHHQAVTPDRLAPGLRATVLHDGLVEAFESPTHRWVIGVQWHPERKAEVGKAAARIFDAFVAEARRSPIRSNT